MKKPLFTSTILLICLLLSAAVLSQETIRPQGRYHALKTGVRGASDWTCGDMYGMFLNYYQKSFSMVSLSPTYTLGYVNYMTCDGFSTKGLTAEFGGVLNFQPVNVFNVHFGISAGVSAGSGGYYKSKSSMYKSIYTDAALGIGLNIWRLEANMDFRPAFFRGDVNTRGLSLSLAYIFSKSRSLKPY